MLGVASFINHFTSDRRLSSCMMSTLYAALMAPCGIVLDLQLPTCVTLSSSFNQTGLLKPTMTHRTLQSFIPLYYYGKGCWQSFIFTRVILPFESFESGTAHNCKMERWGNGNLLGFVKLLQWTGSLSRPIKHDYKLPPGEYALFGFISVAVCTQKTLSFRYT